MVVGRGGAQSSSRARYYEILASIRLALHTSPMKNIMLAWELGGGLGHIANRVAILDVLRERGHTVSLAMRDLRTLYGLRPDIIEPVFAAPNPPGLILPPRQAMMSFADILWHDAGVHDGAMCAAMLGAWRGLLTQSRCELLVADAAPMATLAARSLQIPVLHNGIGFLHPPASNPLPVFRDWEHHDTSYLVQREAQALTHINTALERVRAAPMSSLAEACIAGPLALEGLPEIDSYGPRDTLSWLPARSSGRGQTPEWPSGSSPRIFCYLKHDYAWLDRVMGALARTEARTSMFVDGAKPRLPTGAAIHLHDAPVNTAEAITQCDLVICAAGNGMINEALLAGKPLLLLPTQAEQYINARKVTGLGAGLMVTPPMDKPEFLGPLRRLLSEPAFTEAALRIADRHSALRSVDSVRQTADLIETFA